MKYPDFSFEEPLWSKNYSVIGVDEVGRGALAGPLCVGAVCFETSWVIRNRKHIQDLGIHDSKKLTEKKREYLAQTIQKAAVYSYAFISAHLINSHGIVKATQMATKKALEEIRIKKENSIFLLCDGFPMHYLRGKPLSNQQPIVKGDGKSISIAAASIVAKVARDDYMTNLSKQFPQYGWDKNKGYGTEHHIYAIKQYGKTKHHRDLYLRKLLNISGVFT